MRRPEWVERGRRREGDVITKVLGAEPSSDFKTGSKTLNSKRTVKGSQFSCCTIKEEMRKKR